MNFPATMRRHSRWRPVQGFTLIEVLVALAVVAITLSAGLQATGALTRAATRQTDQWLAQLCAENELTRLRLARQLPGVGDSTVACEQAGRSLQVTEKSDDPDLHAHECEHTTDQQAR